MSQRELTNSERYGVAKMALRNAFDQRVPGQIHDPSHPDGRVQDHPGRTRGLRGPSRWREPLKRG